MALIKSARGKSPQWGERCYFAENATLAGNITMGNDCSVWFGAVIRADVDAIVMGNEVNVQDLACIHQTEGKPVVIEDGASIGHSAVVHGAYYPPKCPRRHERHGARQCRSGRKLSGGSGRSGAARYDNPS